jgi:hypothetical protein
MLPQLLTLTAIVARATANWYEVDVAPQDVIHKDVVIIGGGASGTYAAVRLREDFNKSIVVVERDDHLVTRSLETLPPLLLTATTGRTCQSQTIQHNITETKLTSIKVNTYVDPISGASINYGVQAYLRYSNSLAFFQRLGVPVTPWVGHNDPLPSVYISTTDGSNLTAYEPPAITETMAAFERWLNVTSTYEDQFNPGFWDFFAPGTIPEELLTPFDEFAVERNLTAAIPLMQVISNIGVGGLSNYLTFQVLHAFGQAVTAETLNSSLFVPANHSNSYLYEQAYSLIKEDVLLLSEATAVHRTDTGVSLTVKRKNGTRKLIKAKQLLFTPPPSTENLALYGLDANETAALSTFTNTWSFAAVARIPAITPGTNYYWTSPDAVPDNQLGIRDNPWTLVVTTAPNVPADEHLFEILFASNDAYTHDEAKSKITTEIQQAIEAGSLSAGNGSTDCTVDFVAFADHNSILWKQNATTLQEGIVQDVYKLQGRRSTWFTGGLWSEDYSGNVWAFTDTVVPRILERLG